MNKSVLMQVSAAVLIGAALRFVVNLDPLWWLAWFVPGLLFALALNADAWSARGLIALAALIGVSANMPFLLEVMPLAPVMIVLLLQSLLWVLVLSGARRIVLAYDSAWTVLALPVMAVAADTLLAHFTPDGNWGSLAYTQSEVLQVAQIASVAGVGGILFVLMLANSAIGLAIARGTRPRGAVPAYAAVVIACALSIGLGQWRLANAPQGSEVAFGLGSVDDFIRSGSKEARDVWAQYDAQVTELAGSGAQIVLLPEKIDVLPAQEAQRRKLWLSDLARRHGVTLIAGLGVDTDGQRHNEAWWFAPDGSLVTSYRKHFMAPPEREFIPGTEYPVHDIAGVRYGVAICKDMHFASLGRHFGAREAGVMLVPAWDFDADDWMAANMTKLRGVENGYAIVRSSRNGLLSISDPYGRMLAVERSAKLPGTTLFSKVSVGPRVATIYTRIGDAFDWLCVAAAVLLSALALHGRRRRLAGTGA